MILTFKTEKKITQAKNIQTTEYQFTYTPNVSTSWTSTELTPEVNNQTVYRRERLVFDNGTYGNWGDAVVHARYVADGEPADLIALSSTSEVYKRNLRLPNQYNPDIGITIALHGKYTSATIAVTYGGANPLAIITRRELEGSTQTFNPPVSSVQNVVDTEKIFISIPYDATDYDSVLVTMIGYYDEGFYDELTKEIKVDDVTQRDLFCGCVASLSDLTQSVFLDGDFFVAKDDISGTSYTKGESYIRSNGEWVQMQTGGGNTLKLLTCMNALKSDGIDLRSLNDPNTTSWFTDIIADTLTVRALSAIKAEILTAIIEDATISSLTVLEAGEFQGTIKNSQFETILRPSGTKRYYGTKGPSSRTPGNASGNTYEADAYLGSDLKNNIDSWARQTLNGYLTTPFYSASGNICNYSSFNGLAYINSVSSSKTHLGTTSWTNTFHCPVKVIADYSPVIKTYSYEYSGYTYYWEQVDQYTTGGPNKPSYITGDYTPESWLDSSNLGDIYYENTNIRDLGIAYEWTCTKYQCNREEYSGTAQDTITGTITVTKGGSSYSHSSGAEIPLVYNETVSITINDPSIPQGATLISTTGGSSEISIITADNFSEGIQFFTSSNAKGYLLSQLSNSEQTHNASLTVAGTTWITLTLSASSAWTYNSTYGEIYKLFKFAWNGNAPSISGVSTTFVQSDPNYPTNASIRRRSNASTRTSTNITSVSYSSTSAQWASSTYPDSVNTSEYLEYFDISFSIYDKPTGINSHTILPFDPSTDRLGNSGNKWKSVDATDFYGKLTGNSEGTHTGQVNSLSTKDTYNVWGAVFN